MPLQDAHVAVATWVLGILFVPSFKIKRIPHIHIIERSFTEHDEVLFTPVSQGLPEALLWILLAIRRERFKLFLIAGHITQTILLTSLI